jgi:hypothetical protein
MASPNVSRVFREDLGGENVRYVSASRVRRGVQRRHYENNGKDCRCKTTINCEI